MSDLWTFSPSSQEYLKRCLDVIKPPDPNNKWVKRFKKNNEVFRGTTDFNNGNDKTNIIEVSDSDSGSQKAEISEKLHFESSDETVDTIETEPITKFDFMVQECLKTPGTITRLAENLSVNAIEKINNHLLSKNNIIPTFLEDFYSKFIPTFLKREYCRFSLDLLVNAYKTHPAEFDKTFNIILKDLNIPNTILSDFVQTITENETFKFLNNFIQHNMTPEEFQHNLFTFFTLYKNSKKNSQIQNCMEKILYDNSEQCSRDKNFGKLLLSYLQEQKNIGPFKQSGLIEKTIEIHKTAFKKPCLNIFKEILEKIS